METYIQNLQFFANISWQVLVDAYTIVCAFSTFRLDRIRAKTFFSNFWLLNNVSFPSILYFHYFTSTKDDKTRQNKNQFANIIFSINDEIINVLLILLIFCMQKALVSIYFFKSHISRHRLVTIQYHGFRVCVWQSLLYSVRYTTIEKLQHWVTNCNSSCQQTFANILMEAL